MKRMRTSPANERRPTCFACAAWPVVEISIAPSPTLVSRPFWKRTSGRLLTLEGSSKGFAGQLLAAELHKRAGQGISSLRYRDFSLIVRQHSPFLRWLPSYDPGRNLLSFESLSFRRPIEWTGHSLGHEQK